MYKGCKAAFYTLIGLVLFGLIATAQANYATAKPKLVQGIYLTQGTFEDTKYLSYLIMRAQKVGITTFIIDLERPSAKFKNNVDLLKHSNIQYVARIVVFPDGGNPDQIASPTYWAKRYELIKHAVAYGASEIQLDYIRYNTKQPASPENAKNILKVLQWYKAQLAPSNIPLQADVFGIASFGESKHIGQNLQLMAQAVDALCPMVYPSHYEPYLEHATKPYEIIYDSLQALKAQFDNKPPVKLYAYIELSNYRYPLSGEKRLAYIAAQIKAVKDAGIDGWYAWSAHNQYDYLFRLLEDYQNQVPGNVMQKVEAAKSPLTALPEAIAEPTEIKSIPALAKSKTESKSLQTLELSKEQTTTNHAHMALLPWPLGARHFIY